MHWKQVPQCLFVFSTAKVRVHDRLWPIMSAQPNSLNFSTTCRLVRNKEGFSMEIAKPMTCWINRLNKAITFGWVVRVDLEPIRCSDKGKLNVVIPFSQ